MSLRIPLTVKRCPATGSSKRVRYHYGNQRLIPEAIVLRRWQDRSKEESAKRNGIRFDGCRLPPGTWALLRTWFDAGLSGRDAFTSSVLAEHADRSRRLGLKLRAPEPGKLASMLSFLDERGVLCKVMNRDRPADKPGIPDLFLFRIDRNGRVHGGRFVEVKKWDRRRHAKERVSAEQKQEIAFLAGLKLAAQVVYLHE